MRNHPWYKTTDQYGNVIDDRPDTAHNPDKVATCKGCGITASKREIVTGEYKWKRLDEGWFCGECLERSELE